MGLVPEGTIVDFYTRMPRDAVRLWKEVGDARRSHLQQASSSVPKVKEKTDVKSSNSLKASPAARVRKILVYGEQDEKYRRLIIDIISCVVVTGLETDAFVAFRCLHRHADGASARGTQGAVAILRDEKSPRLCISKLRSNEFYSSESWRVGIERFGETHHEILGMHLLRTKIRERTGQSGGIIQKGELHERNPCAPSSEERTPEGSSRQADCDSKAAWKLARKMLNAEQERFKLR